MPKVSKVRARAGDTPGPALDQNVRMPGDWTKVEPEREGERRSAELLLPVGTDWVASDVLGVAQEIARLHPTLRLASCDCGQCKREGHYPHMVVELTRSGRTVPVLGAFEIDQRILHKLHIIKTSENPEETRQRMNRALRQRLRKQTDEAQHEKLEVLEQAMKSPKQDWVGPRRADGTRIRTEAYATSDSTLDRAGLRVPSRKRGRRH